MVSTPAARARVRQGWGSWLRSWVDGSAPEAVLAAFPLASALTSSAAAALPGTGEKYAALLESGTCDERTLLMLLLVRLESVHLSSQARWALYSAAPGAHAHFLDPSGCYDLRGA